MWLRGKIFQDLLSDTLEIDANAALLTPRAAVETQLECTLLKSGGVIPLILQRSLKSQSQSQPHGATPA